GNGGADDEARQGHDAETLDRGAAEGIAVICRELRMDGRRHPFALDKETPDPGSGLIAIDEASVAGEISGSLRRGAAREIGRCCGQQDAGLRDGPDDHARILELSAADGEVIALADEI